MYEKTKKELNQKLREQKEIHDKENHESQNRFNSLQQQYKILVTKHDDLDQHCTQVQKDLSTENDELKRKLDHIQAQNSKIQTSKDNDITVWKVLAATQSFYYRLIDSPEIHYHFFFLLFYPISVAILDYF